MIKLYSKNESFIGNLENCIECVVEEERNGLFELILTYPVIGDLYLSLEKENIIIADANDTLKAQKFRIYNTRKYMKNQVTVYARHISFDLMHDVIENEISFTNQSCEYALNQIFRNSISSKHFKGYSDIINAQNFKVSKVNCLSAIAGTKGSVIDTFGTGAEILRDNFNIHVLNKRGHDNSVSIEYRKNLTGLEVEEDTTDLVTRILPYATQKVGEEEKTIDYNGYVDAPNINAFSKPYSAWIDYSDKFEQDEEVTQEKLKIYAEREYTVNKRHIPKCNYKIEFIPLSKVVGYKELEDKISLCDTVTIKDTRYGIDTQAKVIKTVYNVLLGRYDSMELGEPKTTLGDVITNNGGSNNSGSNNGGTGGSDSEKVEIDDSNFPNIIPLKPVLSSNVMGFGSVEVSWTFENKSYFKYELYASKVKDFTPNSFYLIYSGQASAFLHVVEPNETWYYRVCGINSHGNRGEFSEQLTVNTTKLDDFEQYFSSLAVKNLVANMFSADYIKAGQIKGTWIDARNLTVTDGNGKRTLDIDSFGNVALDVTSLKISANNVPTFENVKDEIQNSINNYKDTVNKELDDIKDAMDNLGDTLDEAFKDGIINEAEAIAIKQQIQNLEVEKKDIDSVYTTLYANTDLIGTAKTNLYNAKNSYNTAHTNLINAINNAIADKKISTDENTLVKRAFANYGTALATFRTRNEETLDAIANKKKQDAIQYTDTQFNILDGKIQSKITSKEAQSIAEQTVNGFKQTVEATYPTSQSVANSFANLDKNLQSTYATKTLVDQTANSITQTVSKKVGKNEIISSINQTAEVVKIKANKINLDGYVWVGTQLTAPHITGKVQMYMETGSIFSSDGEMNVKRFYGMPNGTFNVESTATFANQIYGKTTGVFDGNLTCKSKLISNTGAITRDFSVGALLTAQNFTLANNASIGGTCYCNSQETTYDSNVGRNLVVNNNTRTKTLSVTGDSTLNALSTATITNTGNATIRGTLTAQNQTINNNLTVSRNIYANAGEISTSLTIGGTVYANGNVNIQKHLWANSLAISGSKNCVQETENYGKRLVNAYETADYYFGDIGESFVENGECIVYLDNIFKEIISADVNYQVFLTKYGPGDIWITERNNDFFVVEGTNDIAFGWEIKGKRKGYENYRLEEYVEEIPGGKEDVQENNAI